MSTNPILTTTSNNNNDDGESFARFSSLGACVLQMQSIGHQLEDAGTICSVIKKRADTGTLLKAEAGLTLLTKADNPDIILGGYASYDCVDREGDIFTVQAQANALERFMKLPKEYQLITIDHGKGTPGEINIAKPILKYTTQDGQTHYTHVNEKGTYLIVKMRDDDMRATQYYRSVAKAGGLKGYSVNAFVLKKDPENPKRVLDMEYSAITLTEQLTPINPKTQVQTLSTPKAQTKQQKEEPSTIEEVLVKYGFNKTLDR